MTETPGLLLVTDYFVEKRSMANGLRAAGNPMGGILFSPLVVFLREEFSLQGVFIIMAGIMLHLAVSAMLMRPFELQEQILHHEHLRKIKSSPEYTENGWKGAQTVKAKPLPKKALDFTLLKNPQYLVYIVVALSVNVALPNFLLYIPAYGRSVGLTNYQTSVMASYVSGADCIMRMLCGYVVQKLHLNEANVFSAG